MNDEVQEKSPKRRRAQMSVNRINNVVVGAKPLCFTISRYKDYENYGWLRFDRVTDYGEIGLLKPLQWQYRSVFFGDPLSVEAMTDGYVYIFKRNASGTKLWKVFTIKSGQYQEVRVTDGVVSYNTNVGPERDHVYVANFFPSEHSAPDMTYIVDSDIKLSQKRLAGEAYSITKKPEKRGFFLSTSYSTIKDLPKNQISGPETLRRYREGGDTPSPSTYHFGKRSFGEYHGFDLRRPHAFKEAERRNDIYCERVQKYQIWLNDEERNKEAYLHQTIAAILRLDADRKDKIDIGRFHQWRNSDNEKYKRHFFPVHYATESLLEWLDDDIFKEWLLDYNHSEDDDEQEAGLKGYVGGIFELSLTARGRDYLAEQFEDKNAFFNMATHIPAIRRDYTDPESHSNFAVEVRKVSNVIFSGLQEFGGIIVKEGGEPRAFTRRFISWAQKRGITLKSADSRVSRAYGNMISHIDMQSLESLTKQSANFANGFKGRSIVSFFEIINLGIAIYGVNEAASSKKADGYHTNVVFSMINAAGAVADIASSGLLEKHTKKLLVRAGWSSTRVYYLAVFSGLVDFVIGLRSFRKELSDGDRDAAFGWAVFATGGVLVAIGGTLQIAGASGAIGSGGLGAVPAGAVILTGFILEAIGLLWVWLGNDDELNEWLINSRFGTNSRNSSLNQEIQSLNDLMCKFEVDVDFEKDKRVTVEIEPRLFPQGSELKITQLSTTAEARFVEYFTGDSDDIAVGGAGHGSITITPESATRAARFEREGKRITKISFDLSGRQDIDAVSGSAHLEIGPGGYLHGYRTKFKVEKGFFD